MEHLRDASATTRSQRLVRHLDPYARRKTLENGLPAPQRVGGSVIPKPPIVQRDVEPGHGWTEPKRRKYRYRIEDVAFD